MPFDGGCGCGGKRPCDCGCKEPEPPCGVILETLRPNPLLSLFSHAPVPCGRPPPQPVHGLPWIVNIQCRDAHWSFNTLWHHVRPGTVIPTCHIIASLRNGVPCRCDCPPGCCRGKLQQFYR